MVHLGSPSKAMALEVCSLLPVTHTDPALCWLREMPPLRCLLSHGFKWLLVPRGLQFPAQFSLSFLRRPLGFWEWKNGEQGDIFILLRNPNPPPQHLGGEHLAQELCGREGAGTQAL